MMNQLPGTPGVIGRLANLTTLNPNCNMVMDVPSELSQLTNPREVSLSHNQLTISPLPGLRTPA